MKTIYDSSCQKLILLRSGFTLLLFMSLVLGGCEGKAKVDLANGAVKGTLKPAIKGTVVVLCLAQEWSCIPLPELSGTTNNRGNFIISMVPPGHYILAYSLPNDLKQGKLNISKDDILDYNVGSVYLEAVFKDHKWFLNKDISSDTHLIASGAELQPSGNRLSNGSIKHKASGLWMEYRDGYRYESVDIEPNKVVEITLNRWAGD